MGIVAVIGGTGGVGRALVEVIKARGKHEVKIFSRKLNDAVSADLGVPIIIVDYSDVEQLTKVFEDNNIDTIISAISTMPGGGTPEVNLVKAAQASKTTKRFLTAWVRNTDLIPTTSIKLQALEEVKKTDLQYTTFYPGFFTDFYAIGAIKLYMTPMTSVVDLAHNIAAIPGLGDVPIVFTHISDVGKYVDAALDLEKWETEYYLIGDKVTWHEFVKLAEAAKGTKFKVVYDSVEDMKKGSVTELPSLTAALPYIPVPKEVLLGFSAVFGLMFDDGTFDFKTAGALNEKFPEIKPITVRAALEAAGKGGQ
ncbi:hypothetical protein BKA61DRAFT_481756 [Leptodontidium sp. MPI-SDFR-AT-0119]|nr:hypothetical protein BKA61DRAFT_481756 [Leptodontidium sp. MPI-SDFR-AT-0119]